MFFVVEEGYTITERRHDPHGSSVVTAVVPKGMFGVVYKSPYEGSFPLSFTGFHDTLEEAQQHLKMLKDYYINRRAHV